MGKTVKYISDAIAMIKSLELTKRVRVSNGGGFVNKTGFLKKRKPKGYFLEIATDTFGRLDVGSKVTAYAENKNIGLKITDSYVRNVGSNITAGTLSHRMQLHIFSFRSKGFRDKTAYYFRSVVLIPKEFSFYNIISDESFYNDEFCSRGLVKVDFNSHKFHVFIVERNKQKYLCTDCTTKLGIEDFMEFNWSVKVALGYLLGNLPQDDEYFFAYRSKEMKHPSGFVYRQQRDSIRAIYTPVNANPFGWIKNHKIAKKYYGKIVEIGSIQLSKLCDAIHNEIDIKAILLLIIESLSRSLLIMPAGLSVALEGLSTFFYEKDSDKLKPITDKSIAKEFTHELKAMLDRYKTKEGFTGYEILLNKIQNINSPTNRELLKAPFTVQKIALTDIDEEILEYRNDFLHGNINLKPQKGRKSYTMDSFEISLRILTLLNMCILKMAGYSGHIINHVKTQEKGLGKKINEDYYRII